MKCLTWATCNKATSSPAVGTQSLRFPSSSCSWSVWVCWFSDFRTAHERDFNTHQCCSMKESPPVAKVQAALPSGPTASARPPGRLWDPSPSLALPPGERIIPPGDRVLSPGLCVRSPRVSSASLASSSASLLTGCGFACIEPSRTCHARYHRSPGFDIRPRLESHSLILYHQARLACRAHAQNEACRMQVSADSGMGSEQCWNAAQCTWTLCPGAMQATAPRTLAADAKKGVVVCLRLARGASASKILFDFFWRATAVSSFICMQMHVLICTGHTAPLLRWHASHSTQLI